MHEPDFSPFTRLLQEAPPQPERNLPALVERQARVQGQRVYVTVQHRTVTFADFRDQVARFAGTLLAAGVSPGDRVAIMCRNRMEFLTTFFGTVWLGAIAVPVNTGLRGSQLAHQLVDSGARLLILDGDLVGCLLPVVAPNLKKVWLLDLAVGELPDGVDIGPLPPPAAPVPYKPSSSEVTCAILYTSGTTGPSKGVAYPADQLFWWAAVMGTMMKSTSDSVIFTTLPLFHIHALSTSVQPFVNGSHCVIMERFSASRFWMEAVEAKATHACLIGAMGNILLAQPPSPLDKAHGIHTVFASSIRSSVWTEFTVRFNLPRRVGGYGSTETNAAFFAQNGWEVQGNMGRPVPLFQADVVDAHDATVPADEPGELVLRSNVPFAFASGYWGAPDATLSAWRNFWFHTGDIVVRNRDGIFRFVGRLKESIRRRGENISAWEVEQAILSHGSVSDSAVFGVPSSIGDEDVMAVVVMREGCRVEPEDLLRHLDKRLAYFAIPRYVEFMAALPLTENGKIKRTELRQRGVTAFTWDREVVGYKVTRQAGRAAT
jgi:crotonobetaine/carnitine-CoA ligase